MTLFGWLYVFLSILGIMFKINEIGKPRKPVSHSDVIIAVGVTVFFVYGLYHWGLTNA